MAPGEAAPRPVPPASLLVLHPSGNRTRVRVEPLPFEIGRQAGNQLVLRDNRASRQHSRVIVEGGQYILEDLGSRHGTWVNGQRITRHLLRNGDVIDFGVQDGYQVTFAIDAGEIAKALEHISSSAQAGLGDNSLVKLRSLVEVARALQSSLSTLEVLTAVVDAALSVTSCERGFLLLSKDGGPGQELEVSVARDREGRPLPADDLRVPTSVIQRALHSRRDLLSMSFDPLEETGVRPEMSVAALELRSVVCLPLIQIRSTTSEDTGMLSPARATVGLLYLDSRAAPADLSAGNRELLQTLAMEASTILENARLIEEERVKQRMEEELKIAREIQQGLIPPELPKTGWFQAAGSSWPSTEVGGDYFDVRRVGENTWAAVVADVSGKGVSSALLASFLQGAFLMAPGDPQAMEQMILRLNAFLLERTRGEKYATVFYCLAEAGGKLYYINAGHVAPFLVSADGRLRKLNTTGMPVGMIEEARFETVCVDLEPGDKVVIYSDGLTEAENARGEFFEAERLKALLRESCAASAAEIHRALVDAVGRFTEDGAARDDVTALVLAYSA